MAKGAADLVSERFGVRVRDTEPAAIATVGTASAVLLRADSMRYAFTFINLSANNIFIRPKNTASATNGIRVDPNGGSVTVILEDDFTLASLEWQAIAAGAGSAFYLLAVVGEPD